MTGSGCCEFHYLGDGYDDVIVGATGHASRTGRAYVYLGYVDADADGVVGADDCDDGDASIGEPNARFIDTDGDGYGTDTSAIACPGAAGFSDISGDCDDGAAAAHPRATEVCDAVDNDCDGR